MTPSADTLRQMPIPAHDGTRLAPVAQAGIGDEPLVQITPEAAPNIRCQPLYHQQDIAGALDACWVRRTVLAKLRSASDVLEARGLTLIVWDAWRPVEVQQALYDAYMDTLRHAHPGLEADALATLAQEFVARPSRDPLKPPPHLTGGAVDVTLGDADGTPLWLGTAYDDVTPRAYTRYFETQGHVAAPVLEDRQARDRRRTLYHVLTTQGFTNYAAEWWHFDFGDRLWAQTVGQPPVYGPAEPPR